jgi:hypothetical protein
MNRRRWLGLCLGVAILAIAVWCACSPIAIFYHKQCIALADRRLAAITKAKMAGNWSDHQSESMWYALRIQIPVGQFCYDHSKISLADPEVD